MRTSCGVLVTDGDSLLLGHATRSTRWDIPKGLAEPGESYARAAVRELAEETGLETTATALIDLGVYPYLPSKQLALFAWPLAMPLDSAGLTCRSSFATKGGALLPEFDRFAFVPWEEALRRVGRNLAGILVLPSVREPLRRPRPD